MTDVSSRPEADSGVFDVRVYRIHEGRRAEFDRLLDDETIPLARRHGHLVVAYGPSISDGDTYFLVRHFESLEERESALSRLYGSTRWASDYESRVMELIETYETTVIPASALAPHFLGGTSAEG